MNICLYGASSADTDQKYISEIEKLGETMAARGHSLVFGGGATGLRGAAARGVHSKGGEITGIAPGFFNVDGVLFEHCTELIITEGMRDRKQTMEDKSDAFIAAPGGIGTFEELLEILTLKQLGRHDKPIVIYNIFGYYDALQSMIEHAISQNFVREKCRELYKFCSAPEEAMEYIENYAGAQRDVREYKALKLES